MSLLRVDYEAWEAEEEGKVRIAPQRETDATPAEGTVSARARQLAEIRRLQNAESQRMLEAVERETVGVKGVEGRSAKKRPRKGDAELTAEDALRIRGEKTVKARRRDQQYGWIKGADDGVHIGFEKSLKKRPVDPQAYAKAGRANEAALSYEEMYANDTDKDALERVRQMASAKCQSHRVRPSEGHGGGLDANDRFTAKIEKAFGSHLEPIQRNIERGTAL